jgi:hypothetical protein
MPRRISTGCHKRSAGRIDCPRRRNGNSPAAPGRQLDIRLVTRSPLSRLTMPRVSSRCFFRVGQARSARIRQTPGASTTCTAMSGSGLRMTGIRIIREPPMTDRHGRRKAPFGRAVACCAVAPGSSSRKSADPPTAPGPSPTLGATLSGSGWPERYAKICQSLDPARSPSRVIR